MNLLNLEVVGLAYSVDPYNDGICGNIWEVYAMPNEGLPPKLLIESLSARDFEDGKVLGIIFPGEGMLDYRGLFDNDYDASEATGSDTSKIAENLNLTDLGEIHSIYA